MRFIKKIYNSRDGQSLVEILIGLAIGALIIGAVSIILSANLKSSLGIKTAQIVSSFSQELLNSARSVSEANWHNIYNITKGTDALYYISSSTQAVISGTEPIVADGKNFTRYFYVENVNRDLCGVGDISTNQTTACSSGPGFEGIADDPSTQKITVVIKSANNAIISSAYEYVTRFRNYSFRQNDWSGGLGGETPLLGPNNKFASSTTINFSSGTIKLQLPIQ